MGISVTLSLYILPSPRNKPSLGLLPSKPPLMEPEEIMSLFDSCWFALEIFKRRPIALDLSSFGTNPDDQNQENRQKPEISAPPATLIRSKSDNLGSETSLNYSPSPNSVLAVPRLQTIVSGKESTEEEFSTTQQVVEEEQPKKSNRGIRRRKKKIESKSKSLSELEFEELKGFMDMGFVFSEEAKEDSSLVEIVPGLQRLGRAKDGEELGSNIGELDRSSIPRPYLSEAWDVWDRRKRENPLMNWRIPSTANEVGMKDSLKWWAHTVASTVR